MTPGERAAFEFNGCELNRIEFFLCCRPKSYKLFTTWGNSLSRTWQPEWKRSNILPVLAYYTQNKHGLHVACSYWWDDGRLCLCLFVCLCRVPRWIRTTREAARHKSRKYPFLRTILSSSPRFTNRWELNVHRLSCHGYRASAPLQLFSRSFFLRLLLMCKCWFSYSCKLWAVSVQFVQ